MGFWDRVNTATKLVYLYFAHTTSCYHGLKPRSECATLTASCCSPCADGTCVANARGCNEVRLDLAVKRSCLHLLRNYLQQFNLCHQSSLTQVGPCLEWLGGSLEEIRKFPKLAVAASRLLTFGLSVIGGKAAISASRAEPLGGTLRRVAKFEPSSTLFAPSSFV